MDRKTLLSCWCLHLQIAEQVQRDSDSVFVGMKRDVSTSDFTVLCWLQVNGRRELRGKDDTAPGIVDVGPALFSQPKVILCL